MRVLIVAMAASVHTVRFMELLAGTGWDLHLFDALPVSNPHPDLPPCSLHATETVGPDTQVDHLERLVDEIRPDLIHAHETSIAGALVDRLHVRRDGIGVPWLVTNWGSDLYWFGRLPSYARRLRSTMTHCAYLNAECHRDIALARAFGFRGEVVGVWPVAGGIDAEAVAHLRTPGPTSARRAIAVKGVSSDYGQALVALDAVERCADLVDGWELCGHQMEDAAEARAREVAAATGMRYSKLSDSMARSSPHEDLLAMHGRARVSIGLNRSDGLSTAFLEALAMGAFPVQAHASCGYELTPSGRGALFVPPADEDEITAALHRALTDDALVDDAAEINRRVVAEHLDRRRIRARVLDAYERIVAQSALVAA